LILAFVSTCYVVWCVCVCVHALHIAVADPSEPRYLDRRSSRSKHRDKKEKRNTNTHTCVCVCVLVCCVYCFPIFQPGVSTWNGSTVVSESRCLHRRSSRSKCLDRDGNKSLIKTHKHPKKQNHTHQEPHTPNLFHKKQTQERDLVCSR
jgi:hypothetical protein